MSESVWFEQVDTALIRYLKDVVKIPNRAGEIISVPVEVRKPDPDFKIEVYPSITIYNLYDRYSVKRQGHRINVVSRNIEKSRLVTERCSVPYDLYYQIDFWSQTITDMNNMSRKWLSTVPRFFNLSVKDMSNNVRSVFVLKTDDFKKSNYISENQRCFHSYVTYKVQVELDENIRETIPMVTEIQVNDKIIISKGGLTNNESNG